MSEKKNKFGQCFNKIISVVIAVSIALTGVTVFALEGEAYIENFNSFKAGTLPSGLSIVTGEGAKVYIDEIPDSADKSVALEGNKNNAFIQRSYTKADPLTGKVYIQADFRFETINSCPLNVEIRDSDDVSHVIVKMMSGSIIAIDGSVAGKYIENKFYTVGMEIDMEDETFSMYVNGRNTVRKVSLKGRNLKDIYFVRFQLSPITVYSKLNIDNLIVKSGGYDDVNGEDATVVSGLQEVGVKNKMTGAAAFYENRYHALMDGTKKDIDAAPFNENGVMYIPLRVSGNGFGAGVDYDSAQNAARVIFGENEYLLKNGENCYYKYGQQYPTDAPIMVVNGRTYASVKTICDIFDKYVFEDKRNGLTIFSNEENFISWENDFDLLNEIVAEFIYTDYSAEELISMLREKNPDNMHPRIMATPDTFKELRENVETDEFLKKVYADIKASAESTINSPVSAYSLPDGLRLLEISRRSLTRIAELSFMYNMTGEDRYAQRAWQEIYTITYYPNWNENHFLDVAEMSAAFAIGYDWLYNWLDDDQKQRMRTAMINNGLNKVMDDYEDNPRTRTYRWSTAENPNNWTFVCNGGLAMAAAAIFDDEAEELCGKVLENGLVNVRRALKLFAPSGSYGEGSNYWNYATRYFSFYVATLQSAFGSDLGYFDVPGMRNTVEFIESINGPAGYYNFSDSGASTSVMRPAQMMLFADKLNKPYLGTNRINSILQGKSSGGWEDALYYKKSDLSENQMPLDKYSDIVETMSMRSSYNDDALYLGFHNGNNAESHSHLDLGGFILDSEGERFIMDLGADDYNLPNYKNCYRYKAEGHNTLVINPDVNADQSHSGIAKIVRYDSKPKGAYAIADLTDAYGTAKANKIQRGIMMTEGRQSIVILDELDLVAPSEVYWFAHTDASDIEISADGTTAILTKRGKKMKAEILSDGVFEVMDAKPLPTSPIVVGQNENIGIKKLAIHYTNLKSGTISVGFAPYYSYYDFEEVKPLDEWEISEGELEYATINGIDVDGKPLEGFNKDIFAYTVRIPADATVKNIVTSDGTVTDMREDGRYDGTVVIQPTSSSGISKAYTITFAKETILGISEALIRIPIAKYEASAEPQPDVAPVIACFDGDLTTRWASEGHNTMDMDLGTVHNLYGVAIAFWRGNLRTTTLKIEISEDGENYETIYEGESCGESEDFEVFEVYGKKARYVRTHFYGTSEGTWNSILDIAVLKE